ncbi:polysaccharide pyruvyl transferase family protein [Frigidibacter oleivorans]|uniref:polysaccharide pyruvyl transferase family protein n=1 Tax=Frigidibacter oleivorans TaxID=2487129 RepID=UPI000F8D20A9|nr:polysaccharide pyruvyl transferase family protein [Frigidibacter oleivorans]
MKKTVLFSYQQLSNVGCEIIIRGTVAFLARTFPQYDLEFVVSSYNPERDRALLADVAGVRVVPMQGWKRYLRGFLQKTGLFDSRWVPRFATSEFRRADLFCSVGGDIYTMFGNSIPHDWLGYENFATRHGIPSIMFGANMERFEIVPEADRRKLIDHLKRFKVLAVRDAGTVEYLGSHGVSDNVTLHPDPCFCLRPITTFERRPIRRIAINFTPILTRDFGAPVVERFAKVVEALVGKGYEVSLVPHVYSSEGLPSLSDPDALARLYSALSPDVQAKVLRFEGPISFATVAAALREIDLFVGGRMHGCLNSLTLGKAVCFVGYSRKVRTMVDWLASESPFSVVSQSYGAVPADEIDAAWLEQLIAAHDAWAAADPDGKVVIDTQAYLDSLSARARVAEAVDLSASRR